ncbi:DNA ligase D [Parasphingopyxis marina]|uniref:DNA ligase (ATP) n=1 Tax=Parasphingopyxis marina TaxID=2761622 RepID=A0A842HW15_9SPHN|nr:DNA ligase D [Parasphingopyxis marina]MBC2776617.1 DNA ligase D [Parasphingopyxis marina]
MAADLLAEYNRKRDFAKTAEPAGKIGKGEGDLFIVQKHDATRLHYDFRLEVDGVMKSWAVTKGPSLDPDDKRLAVRTEDHPMSYAEFEGTIPKGEYGGGTVMLWDKGRWAPVEGKSAKDIDKGHLHFVLDGERMKGEWLLVRMRKKPGEKRENWLLRKLDDRYAGASDELTGREVTSVKTGRSMAEIAADKAGKTSLEGKKGKAFDKAMAEAESAAAKAKKRTRKKSPRRTVKLPEFRKPQLATLVDAVPAGNNWLHEIKYDGYRALVAAAGGKAKIYTRSGLDWTAKFPDVAEAFAAFDLPGALIDGEIVALDAKGNPDFSTLQKRLKEGGDGFVLFAFDLLELDGESVADRPLIERKERLAALIGEEEGAVRFSDHIIGAGEKLYKTMCDAGQEGIIAKQADAPYRGRRTTGWVKVKCTRRQEFVIVGWSESSAKGRPFSSLLLGQNIEGELCYRGKVGTGFDRDMLEDMAARLGRIERKTPPVEVPKAEARGAHWVTPKLVAEVAFAELTADDRVRHASFIGLRSDKEAEEVTPEKAKPVPERKPASGVKITHPDRVIFPDAKATKGDLAAYYETVGAPMLEWLADRPVSLVRCPQGRAKKCFFQKHDSGSFGEHVHHVPIEEKTGDVEDYLYVSDVSGILACVQMGTIEFHGWGSRIDALEKPDRLVFDLDPDEGLDFGDVKKAALDIRKTLEEIGLVSFAMLSGGKGVHVVVPIRPEAEWGTVKDFTSRFARALAAQQPDRFTATMSKEKRKGKIFIDWLRNQRGSTSVMPYSARAREGAPVAAPLTWEELAEVKNARTFSISDGELLQKRSVQMTGWGWHSQVLASV